jgi:hypothetical protein
MGGGMIVVGDEDWELEGEKELMHLWRIFPTHMLWVRLDWDMYDIVRGFTVLLSIYDMSRI